MSLGDKNTRYFHQSCLKRKHNRIMALQKEENQWICEDSQLQSYMIQFYANLYSSADLTDSIFPTSSSYPMIKVEDRAFIEGEETLEETKKALFSMNNYKSPLYLLQKSVAYRGTFYFQIGSGML